MEYGYRREEGSEEAVCSERLPEPTSYLRTDKIREITISQLDHGYVIRVGCQTVAIESKDKVIDLIGQYISNPADTETKYNNKELF